MRFILLATFLSSATAGTNQVGKDFLAEKRKESDVIELQSGLLYKVLREGRRRCASVGRHRLRVPL